MMGQRVVELRIQKILSKYVRLVSIAMTVLRMIHAKQKERNGIKWILKP